MIPTRGWRRAVRLFGPDPKADVDNELRFHLESKVEDLIARGWSAADARREAERLLGDVDRLRRIGVGMQDAQAARARRWMSAGEWARDLRLAARSLARDRGFTAVTVAIIALTLAANATVFSVVNTLLLRPLPFPDSDRLTWFTSGQALDPGLKKAAGLSVVTYTVDAYEEFQRHTVSFDSVTSYNPFFGNSEYTLTGHGEARAVNGVMVAGNFFKTLGVEPALGRLFVPEELQQNGPAAVLLDHGFWIRQFAGDPAVLGEVVNLNGQPATIVGVLPASFDFGAVFAPGTHFEVFTPLVMDVLRNWGNTLAVIGRLKPGVTLQGAQAEADVLFPRFKEAHPEWWGDYTSRLTGLKQFVGGQLRRPLIVLWSAVGLLMLMVCVNLSNLLLARTAARSREFVMRRALGAGRSRLFRQLLTESLVLAGAGSALGLALAIVLTAWLARQETIALPLLGSVGIDGASMAWTAALAVATALVLAVVPLARLSTGSLQSVLRDGGQGLTASPRHERFRGVLVITEVALACVLLVCAGLLLRSFLRVLDVDLGFRPARAAVIKIDYDGSGDGQARAATLSRLLTAVSAIPGVEAAGVADMLPLGRNRSWGLKAKGRAYAENDPSIATLVRIVTPGYLEAMGMRMADGRSFAWNDLGTHPIVIVNEAAARLHWPGESPVGRLALTTGSGGWQDTDVIGVVADVREHSLESQVDPEMYLPVWQGDPEGAELVVRTALPPASLAPTVLQTLRRLNPNQPATTLEPLERIVDRAVSPRRFFVLLVATFAGLGLLLAALGIYGVIAYSVRQRTSEIGVRMALGASATRVRREVIGRAMRLSVAGALVGALVSAFVARAMASLLFQTAPWDPATFLAIVTLLLAIAAAAAYLPARRASRIEPLLALRAQ